MLLSVIVFWARTRLRLVVKLLLTKVSELFSYIMGAFDHLAQSSETDPSQAIGPK